MRKLNFVLWVIIHQGETDVTFLKYPYCERVPIRNKHPLANIKLPFVDDQRILNILLYHPVSTSALTDMLQYLIIISQHNNASATTRVARFHDPEILVTTNVILRILLLEL